MKKTMMTLVLAATIGIMGLNIAEARRGGGWMMGGGDGYGPGDCGGPRWSQKAPVDNPAFQAFFNETADLRKQLFEKRGEYAGVLNQENPDKDVASQIWSEIFDLQAQIHAKAKAAGIERGYGRGGHFMGGFGGGHGPCGAPGSCWAPETTN